MRPQRRRRHRYAEAAEAWRHLLEAGAGPALAQEARRALAIHHEHRSRDLGLALRLVEQGLAGGEPSPPNVKSTADFRRRRERLKRTLGSEAMADRRPPPGQPPG